MAKRGKLIVVSAPSGSGKTTIVRRLLENPELNLAFSVSATSRQKRKGEINGLHYYFLSPDEFKKKVLNGEFLEWEEVYPGYYYGTLKKEVERLLNKGKNVIFDIDVKGGLHIKEMYPQDTLSLFVLVPDISIIEERLKRRNTEDKKSLRLRILKAKEEWQYAPYFDQIIFNDQLDAAVNYATENIKKFINEKN